MSRSTRHAPPLVFALFWLGFTSVHAFFMLRGFWGSWAMLGLVPFYAVFFGVGILMLRMGWLARGLQARFGRPELQPLAPVRPGQSLQLGVAFDRDWSREAQLSGQLAWVEVTSRGASGRHLAEAPVTGSAGPGPRGSLWQGMAVVPPRPAGGQRLRLELLLQEAGEKPGSGWRLELPLQVTPGSAEALELSPVQRQQLDRVLGWIFMGLVAVGSWQLYDVLASGRRALFALVLPGAFLMAAWLLHDLRPVLASTLGAGASSREAIAARLQPFAVRARQRLQYFLTFAVGAFFADVFGLLDKL